MNKSAVLQFILLVVLAGTNWTSKACGESYFPQPLSQHVQESEFFGFARFVKVLPEENTVAYGEFEITEVLHGDKVYRVGDKVCCWVLADDKPGGEYCLLNSTTPPHTGWEIVCAATERKKTYLRGLLKIPAGAKDRAKYFTRYLEDEDEVLGYQAMMELSVLPYATLQVMKPELKRQELLKWIQDEKMPVDRRRQYLRLLSICGTAAEIPALEALLKKVDLAKEFPPNDLRELIACYLSLQGESGLPSVAQQFLQNERASIGVANRALWALEQHRDERTVIPRGRVEATMKLVLSQPGKGGLIVEDLIKWEDWSATEKLFEVFKKAGDDKRGDRMYVILYLHKCPQPAAKALLKECERLDPKSWELAQKWFPVLRPEKQK